MTTVQLSALLEQTGSAAFTWEGERIEFVFCPGAFTAAFLSDLDMRDEAWLAAWLAEKALTSWSLVDDNDRPLPITVETTRTFPAPLKRMFLQAMRRWQTPTESELRRPGCTARRPGRTASAMPAFCPAPGMNC